MRTPARPRLPDGDCVFISDGWIVACADVPRHRGRHGATVIRPSTHPCAHCLLGFETLKDFEFRNREGGCMRETTSAPNRRSRGSSRRFCPSGTRSRRFSSLARGMNPTPGRACSCWTSRGGCSASRGSERHVGLSRGSLGKKTAKGNAPAFGSTSGGKPSTSYHRPRGSSNAHKSIWTQAKPPASSVTHGKAT